MEWLFSVPWLRIGWYRKVQAGGMVVFSTLVEGWMYRKVQAGGMVVFSTLIEGWMVQEEAVSLLVVHEAPGRWNGCIKYLG